MESINSNPAFKDAKGREWFPRLDYVKLRRLRAEVAVDLGNVDQMGREWAELLYDDLKALETLWVAIDGGARGDFASKDDWLSAMTGELLEPARDALRDAVYLFTPPLKRPLLRQGLDAVQRTYKLAIAEAEERVRNQVEPAIQSALNQARGMLAPNTPADSAGSMTLGRSAKPNKRRRPNGTTNGRANRGR